MKIMFVSNQKFLRESMPNVLKNFVVTDDIQVISIEHENALKKFLDKNPEAVLICEYDEVGPGTKDWNQGRTTFKDISGSADKAVKIIRIGLSDYSYEDYMRIPFNLSKLTEKLGLV